MLNRHDPINIPKQYNNARKRSERYSIWKERHKTEVLFADFMIT